MADKTAAQGELLFNRLTRRYRHLQKWARRTGTNAYRLYDRDIPEIPLVLDLYADAVVGALYKRPYEKDESEEKAWLGAMKASCSRALDIPENRIYLKERQRMRDRQESGNQYGRISIQSVYRDIRENDLVFRANLSDYLDTGLFLDGRKKRALIRSEAAGKRILNLFAYTCSLSVAAAKGVARQVDSVDLSNTYLEWGRINFALNGLESRCIDDDDYFRRPEHGCPALVRSDVMQFISQAAARKYRWDIVILDPPSFSNSKSMRGTLDIRRDHPDLIRHCLSLLSPDGTLYFSSSAKGFRFNENDFPGYVFKDMEKDLIDDDFIGKRIPVCFRFTARKTVL